MWAFARWPHERPAFAARRSRERAVFAARRSHERPAFAARRLVACGMLSAAATLGCRETVYLGDPIAVDGRVVPDAEPPGDGPTPGDADTRDAQTADVLTPGDVQMPGDARVDGQAPFPWYLHAVGSKIFDSSDTEVRLRGISWSGMESERRVPDGLHIRTVEAIVTQIEKLGFNLIRIPFSSESVSPSSVPVTVGGIDPLLANPSLAGSTSLEVLDRILAVAFDHRLRVVLDRYRFRADDRSPPSGAWYSGPTPESPQGGYPQAQWIADWVRLAQRYLAQPNMVGCDLHDEPATPSTWGDGNLDTDWRLAAERAGNTILGTNPNLVILVGGIDVVNGLLYWPGGNLRAAEASPVRLTPARQLIYSIHDYGRSVNASASWFTVPGYPDNLPALWNDTWGHLVTSNRAPVIVGAFGDRKNETDIPPEVQAADQAWRQKLTSYLAANQLSFVFWSLNPSAEGKTGLLGADWQTPDGEWSTVLQLNPPSP